MIVTGQETVQIAGEQLRGHPRVSDIRTAIIGGFAVIAVTLGGLVGWAATAPIASAVVAPGTVIVEGRRKQVQHVEGGTVEEIMVDDGAHVESGQLLLRLDATRARASLGVIQTALDAAHVLQARLIAERDGSALRFPEHLMSRRHEPTLAEMMHAQEMVFQARRASFLGQQSILRQRIAQYEQQITGLMAQQTSLERQIEFIEDELRGLRELLAKGIAPKTKVFALEREAARLNGARGERVAEIARLRIAVGETQLQILQTERAFHEAVVKEIRDVQTQIADLEERMRAARSTLSNTEVRAPATGTVMGLTAHTVGGVIKAGEVILEIVPDDQRLLVEAEIQPADIDSVAVGMEAMVRLTAFKQRTTPTFVGRVIYVSADRLADHRMERTFYLVRVEVPQAERQQLGTFTLQPGMPAEVLIKRRERTVLSYLLQPLTDAMARAWHEE